MQLALYFCHRDWDVSSDRATLGDDDAEHARFARTLIQRFLNSVYDYLTHVRLSYEACGLWIRVGVGVVQGCMHVLSWALAACQNVGYLPHLLLVACTRCVHMEIPCPCPWSMCGVPFLLTFAVCGIVGAFCSP